MEYGKITLPNFLYIKLRKQLGRDFKPDWINYGSIKNYNFPFEEIRDEFEYDYKKNRVKEKLYNSIQEEDCLVY